MMTKKRSSKFDTILWALCLLLFIFSSSLLLSQKLYVIVFENGQWDSSNTIAQLFNSKNDVRFKRADSFAWSAAGTKQELGAGDSIFSGEGSTTTAVLKNDVEITIGENSLVRFTNVDDVPSLNLSSGNFSVKVKKGKAKLMVGGELVEIKGQNSVLQVVADKYKKPQFKLLKGNAEVSFNKTAQSLKLNLNTVQAQPVAARTPAAIKASPIVPKNTFQILSYTYKLYDMFENANQNIQRKSSLPKVVKNKTKLFWYAETPPEKVQAELSEQKNFQNLIESKTISGTSFVVEFEQARLGLNYYRFSGDRKEWSATESFMLKGAFLSTPAPAQTQILNEYVLNPNSANILIRPNLDPSLTNYLVEVSNDRNFAPEVTKIYWTDRKGLTLKKYSPEIFYTRYTGINAQQELTSTSRSYTYVVSKPKPVLAAVKKPKEEPRKPAAVEEKQKEPTNTISTKAQPKIPDYLNRNYTGSKWQLEGSAFTMYSQEQIDQGYANPTALTFGARVMHWFGPHAGVEGSIRSKLATLNGSGPSDVSPLQVEAKYHYRFDFGFSPFSKLGSSQMSLILGYEMYRNSNNQIFSPSYDLIKTGAGFLFPLARRMDTGGELLYGTGLDASRKYEVTGHINYFLDPKFSLGVGYRIHLFEAGSAKSAPAPTGIPYREGFGEGFSVIRWHY